MMTSDEAKLVSEVYLKLSETEYRGWNGIDDYLVLLDFLDDDQLNREAEVIYEEHKNKKVRCPVNHPASSCIIPKLVESTGSILNLYKETGNLHPKNKYILQYYLAINQSGMILSD